ncbi:MAG: ATP-binding protein [Candidatus Falkowbacteria bacterium]
MPIKLQISPRLVKSVSSLYNDPNRIFMEYIDNALDSAEHWYDSEFGGYTRPINITLQLDGKKRKGGQVTITDNCFGITNFAKVVQNIGDSDKKTQIVTNGTFGFGMCSFMAACEKLEVSTKLKDTKAQYIPILRSQFDEAKQEDVQFPDFQELKNFPYSSGTIIILSEFDADGWKQLNTEELIREVERHFELLLQRNNLTIKIINDDGVVYICRPFDYSVYKGDDYEDHITHFITNDRRTNAGAVKTKVDHPVDIFLKMTKGETINRPPVFISKGRRVCEIKDVRAFKSKHKSDVWGHPNVTGYIDLKALLGPTIARTDFRNNNNSKALFGELIELEDVIYEEFIKKANLKSEERHYEQLEDQLNKILSKLARLDSMNFRTDHIKGNDVNLKTDAFGAAIEVGHGAKDPGDGNEIETEGGVLGTDEGEGVGPSDTEEGELPTDKKGGDKVDGEEQFEDSDVKGKERKKSGFNIRISDAEPQVDGESGKPVRSLLVGSEILIYKKHPDFDSRVSHTRQGETKISERLITYIAGEITVHYKDKYYNKLHEGQPEYNINMFVGLMEFVYQFEELLAPLAGRNLSDL